MKKAIFYMLCFLGSFTQVQAQSLDLGIGIGGSLYWGDLNGPDLGKNLSNTNLAIQLSGNYTYSRYFSFRGNLLYGKLKGDDSKSTFDWQKLRNLNFKSVIIEASLLTEFHIFGYNNLDQNSPFSPFVAVGVSGFYFNPQTVLDGQTYDLQPLGTEGQGMTGFGKKYNRISGAIVFGAGVKIKLAHGLTLVVDGLARRTFTDYIDDVSGSYVSYPELAAGNGEISARLGNRFAEFLGQSEPIIIETGSQRGGKFINDYFMTGMATFYINLSSGSGLGKRGSNTTKCPTF